jgi:ribonuclease P protein component
MLPLPYRLPTIEFSSLLKRGKRVNSPEINLVYQKGKDNSRFGFVVSTKVSKQAVTRNRVKRLMRESVHHMLGSITKGYDYVWFARSPIQTCSQKEVKDIIVRLLERAKLIQK